MIPNPKNSGFQDVDKTNPRNFGKQKKQKAIIINKAKSNHHQQSKKQSTKQKTSPSHTHEKLPRNKSTR